MVTCAGCGTFADCGVAEGCARVAVEVTAATSVREYAC